ncbi:translation initiation factor IF-2-like [Lutra lutra]|uniref:translation initiation factor IF-2-like n=1 Tax=Lutra lutra TaxID=9657 RepID=UPI001FD20906|nr:translation initiation factor IF-2-like [Lutra lutra]XP_047568241.1 translation initiation factor IF-2-like [Lutra lutra]
MDPHRVADPPVWGELPPSDPPAPSEGRGGNSVALPRRPQSTGDVLVGHSAECAAGHPFPGDSHTKSKPDSLTVHILGARMRREAQHTTSNAPATRAAQTRRVTRTQTRRLPVGTPAGTAATGRQLLTLYLSSPEARELQSRADSTGSLPGHPRHGRAPQRTQAPSHSPSASPARPGPRPRAGDRPQEGHGTQSSLPACHMPPTWPVISKAAPNGGYPTPFHYMPPRKHWPDARQHCGLLSLIPVPKATHAASLSQTVSALNIRKHQNVPQTDTQDYSTLHLSPLTHWSAPSPTSPLSPIALDSGVRGRKLLPHGEKPSRRPGPQLPPHLGHEPGAQRLVTQHQPRRAQGSQSETQTLCGEDNSFRKLKAIVHILRGLREENHPQGQDATGKNYQRTSIL